MEEINEEVWEELEDLRKIVDMLKRHSYINIIESSKEQAFILNCKLRFRCAGESHSVPEFKLLKKYFVDEDLDNV